MAGLLRTERYTASWQDGVDGMGGRMVESVIGGWVGGWMDGSQTNVTTVRSSTARAPHLQGRGPHEDGEGLEGRQVAREDGLGAAEDAAARLLLQLAAGERF
jgi:hypothetical protein